MSLLDTPIARLDGTPATLGEITGGKPALLVNVASRCGLTPQYTGLEQLHKEYADCGFTVEHIDPVRSLVLHSTSHLPEAWRRRHDVSLDWSWTFVLAPIDDRRTRFAFRSRWRTSPWWVTVAGRLVIVPADFVMSRDMLRGVKQRAEGAAVAVSGRGVTSGRPDPSS